MEEGSIIYVEFLYIGRKVGKDLLGRDIGIGGSDQILILAVFPAEDHILFFGAQGKNGIVRKVRVSVIGVRRAYGVRCVEISPALAGVDGGAVVPIFKELGKADI